MSKYLGEGIPVTGDGGVTDDKEQWLSLDGKFHHQDGRYIKTPLFDLSDTVKSTLTDNKIPLKEFAAITYSTGTNTISSYNGDFAIDILANPLPGYDSTGIENQIEKDIVPGMDLSNVKVTFGEREDINENIVKTYAETFLKTVDARQDSRRSMFWKRASWPR